MSDPISEQLSAAKAVAGDRLAIVDTGSGRRVTWAELDAEVDRVVAGFERLGLVPGHRVVLATGNRLESVTGYLAALRAGLVAVPVLRSATGEVVRLLADCGARVALADPGMLTAVRQAAAGIADALVGADDELRRSARVPQVVTVAAPALPGELTYDVLTEVEGHRTAVGGDPERLAVLLYTSGTSGRPRAAMLSHRALTANVEQTAAMQPPLLTADDVVLGVLPLSHVYGLNAVLGSVLRHRARLVLVDGFDPEGTLATIREEEVTVLPVAPPVFAHWQGVPDLGDRLRGVRVVLCGAAPLSPALVEEFTARTGLDVHQGYGLTEASPVVTSTWCSSRTPAELARLGSVGRALPGVEVRLVEAGGTEPVGTRPPERGDAGEIAVRGANVFSGYWPDGADGPDDQGWFRTGDIGFLDDEGDLFLVDRVKELVIVSGFNVYPREVEDVLDEVAGVAESAVVGAADPLTGERVVAYVRPAGTSYEVGELEQQVRAHCALRLARFKQPTEVHVVDELPHTPTGKVAKGRLRAAGRPGARLLQ